MALSRIAQACSYAGPKIQVIVRDNSGNAVKRQQMAQFQSDYCRLIATDPCSPFENFAELVRLAEGDFVFILADDDIFFDRMIAGLPTLIDQFGREPHVIGMTGAYVMEGEQASVVTNYPQLDADDVVTRLKGYLGVRGANVLYYSPHRRTVVQSIFDFMRSMPTFFSFHDQITCMLYLLNGKYVPVPRIMYGYDIGAWATAEGGQKVDTAFYKKAGLDSAMNKLHWFLCGFEGAMLIRNSNLFPDHPAVQRQVMADQWFSVMFMRFLEGGRMTFESAHTAQADILCQKLHTSRGQISFERMLADIVGLMALSSPDLAERYFRFWSTQLNRRQLTAPAAGPCVA